MSIGNVCFELNEPQSAALEVINRLNIDFPYNVGVVAELMGRVVLSL